MYTSTNKWKFLSVALTILVFGLYRMNIRLKNLMPQIIEKIDTVYIQQDFQIQTYSDSINPKKVYVYQSKYNSESKQKNYDSIIQVNLSKNKLDLSILNKKDSVVRTNQYEIDLDNYKYIYSNGSLTNKRTISLQIKPYAQVSYKPFNNIYEIGGGIGINYNKLILGVGVDIMRFQDKYKPDMEISLKYNF
jgi:hypothetical protein